MAGEFEWQIAQFRKEDGAAPLITPTSEFGDADFDRIAGKVEGSAFVRDSDRLYLQLQNGQQIDFDHAVCVETEDDSVVLVRMDGASSMGRIGSAGGFAITKIYKWGQAISQVHFLPMWTAYSYVSRDFPAVVGALQRV